MFLNLSSTSGVQLRWQLPEPRRHSLPERDSTSVSVSIQEGEHWEGAAQGLCLEKLWGGWRPLQQGQFFLCWCFASVVFLRCHSTSQIECTATVKIRLSSLWAISRSSKCLPRMTITRCPSLWGISPNWRLMPLWTQPTTLSWVSWSLYSHSE